VHLFGQKIGKYIFELKLKLRGFLAAGAENLSLESATKTFTIND
jgi:hypothetical protein